MKRKRFKEERWEEAQGRNTRLEHKTGTRGENTRLEHKEHKKGMQGQNTKLNTVEEH